MASLRNADYIIGKKCTIAGKEYVPGDPFALKGSPLTDRRIRQLVNHRVLVDPTLAAVQAEEREARVKAQKEKDKAEAEAKVEAAKKAEEVEETDTEEDETEEVEDNGDEPEK